MPQQISTFSFNPMPIKAVNVNLTDYGNYSNNPIELQYDSYNQTLNINVHRALQDVCTSQYNLNNVLSQFTLTQSDVWKLNSMMNEWKPIMTEWKDLIDAYHKNEAVRRTIDQAKLVAGLAKDE